MSTERLAVTLFELERVKKLQRALSGSGAT